MCAARVEILSDHVLVKYKNVILGRGRGAFELRDFDPEMDVLGTKIPKSSGSISFLTLELGEHVGRATIRTRAHDTAIDIEVARSSAEDERKIIGMSGGIIFDETYGRGQPTPVPIVDSDRNILAIVNHRSSSLVS